MESRVEKRESISIEFALRESWIEEFGGQPSLCSPSA